MTSALEVWSLVGDDSGGALYWLDETGEDKEPSVKGWAKNEVEEESEEEEGVRLCPMNRALGGSRTDKGRSGSS